MRGRWIRGAGALALFGLATAAMLVSPAGAVLSRKDMKQIAKKISNKAIDNLFDQPGIITRSVSGSQTADSIGAAENLADFDVPPGDWAVIANVELYVGYPALPPSNPRVDCQLVGGDDGYTGVDQRSLQLYDGADFPPIGFGSIPLAIAVHVKAGDTEHVNLFCQDLSGQSVTGVARTVAIKAPGVIKAVL